MPSLPKSPFATRSKPAKKPQIRMGNDIGDSPTIADVTTKLRNPRIVRGNGGLDYIEMDYDLAGEGERVVDFQMLAGFIRQIEVWQEPENKGDPYKFVAWGEIISQRTEVKGGQGGGERIIVTASIMPYHFGIQLRGGSFRRPTGGHDAVIHHDQIVFNPVVDELVENNRSNYSDTATVKYKHAVHPESVRTAAGKQYGQDSDSPSAWNLADVVLHLIWRCNSDETYITNPSEADVNAWLSDPPTVRDLKIPAGKYLNEYLDLILAPYGYGWRLEYSDDGADVRSTAIVLFSLNDGQVVELYQQRPDDPTGAKFTLSNVVDFDIDQEIMSLANQTVLHGGFIEREVTVELFRGWPETDDDETSDSLTISSNLAGWTIHQSAWRLWVGNEAGDYCNTRLTVAPIGTSPLDLTGVLGANTLPRRRRAEDCLTLSDDDPGHGARRRRPPFLEWYNESNQWVPIPSGWGEVILTDQLGVYFAGDSPPEELLSRGANARLRITCTLIGDTQMTSTASHNADSPNGRTNQLYLDVSDRFKNRALQGSGDYASVLGSPATDTRNDQAAMDAFAEKLRSIEDCAVIRGTAKLFGIHLQYKIGQIVKRVKGRNLSLNRLATTATAKKYLQITGIELNHQQQETLLTMSPTAEAPGKLALE